MIGFSQLCNCCPGLVLLLLGPVEHSRKRAQSGRDPAAAAEKSKVLPLCMAPYRTRLTDCNCRFQDSLEMSPAEIKGTRARRMHLLLASSRDSAMQPLSARTRLPLLLPPLPALPPRSLCRPALLHCPRPPWPLTRTRTKTSRSPPSLPLRNDSWNFRIQLSLSVRGFILSLCFCCCPMTRVCSVFLQWQHCCRDSSLSCVSPLRHPSLSGFLLLCLVLVRCPMKKTV